MATGCKECRHTKFVPTSFDSSGASCFVECPYCGSDVEFKGIMGWSPREEGDKP